MTRRRSTTSREGHSNSYKFLPDVALADIAFLAKGDSLGSLFEACAAALTETMVDRRNLRATVSKELSFAGDAPDNLLYDFLTELIVLKDVDSLVFKTFGVSVAKDGKSMASELRGEQIDRERHHLRNDVKAVTMHLFGVKKDEKTGRWEATVVLDI